MIKQRRHGEVRDAILAFYRTRRKAASLKEVREAVEKMIGPVSESAVRSYLWRYGRSDGGPGRPVRYYLVAER